MLRKIAFYGWLLIVVGCTPADNTITSNQLTNDDSGDVHSVLSITPQPNNQLCWYDENHFVRDWDTFTQNPILGDGLASGLIPKTGSQIGEQTYQFMSNTPIYLTYYGYYHDSKNTEATLPVRYIALLNEQQLVNSFDSVDTPYHDVVFNYHQTQTFDMTLPALDEGLYELIVIGIQQSEFFTDGRSGNFVTRLTLIVGTPSIAVDTTQYELIQPSEYRNNTNNANYWSLTIHDEQSRDIWAYPNIYKPATNPLDFYISVGYMENLEKLIERGINPQPQPIALVAFLDYIQVPIQPDRKVFYGLITPDNSYTYIPANIALNSNADKAELLVVRITYPRIPYCLLIPPAVEPYGVFFYFPVDIQRYGIEIQS